MPYFTLHRFRLFERLAEPSKIALHHSTHIVSNRSFTVKRFMYDFFTSGGYLRGY